MWQSSSIKLDPHNCIKAWLEFEILGKFWKTEKFLKPLVQKYIAQKFICFFQNNDLIQNNIQKSQEKAEL